MRLRIDEFREPPLLSYKRSPSLRDKLVKSDVGPRNKTGQMFFGPPKAGNFPCLGCASCNNMLRGDEFTQQNTGRRFRIKQRYTCSSRFLIYMITCPCNLVYIGETTMEIRQRISKHKSTIRTGMTELPIPKHFAEKQHSINHLKFRVIDSVAPL